VDTRFVFILFVSQAETEAFKTTAIDHSAIPPAFARGSTTSELRRGKPAFASVHHSACFGVAGRFRKRAVSGGPQHRNPVDAGGVTHGSEPADWEIEERVGLVSRTISAEELPVSGLNASGRRSSS
jgi:hypothetical protein